MVKISPTLTIISVMIILFEFLIWNNWSTAKNPNKGITLGCLNMVNFGKEIDKKKVKKAMEKVRVIDLKEWRNDRNLKSFNDKKKDFLEKVG